MAEPSPAAADNSATLSADGELSRKDLVALSHRPERFRKKFESKDERRAAKNRCYADAEAAKCSIDGRPVRRWLCAAGPKEIGQASTSLGIELYFLFLQQGGMVLFLWGCLVSLMIAACAEPSEGDDNYGVSPISMLTLASFGDQAKGDPQSRVITVAGVEWDITGCVFVPSAKLPRKCFANVEAR